MLVEPAPRQETGVAAVEIGQRACRGNPQAGLRSALDRPPGLALEPGDRLIAQSRAGPDDQIGPPAQGHDRLGDGSERLQVVALLCCGRACQRPHEMHRIAVHEEGRPDRLHRPVGRGVGLLRFGVPHPGRPHDVHRVVGDRQAVAGALLTTRRDDDRRGLALQPPEAVALSLGISAAGARGDKCLERTQRRRRPLRLTAIATPMELRRQEPEGQTEGLRHRRPQPLPFFAGFFGLSSPCRSFFAFSLSNLTVRDSATPKAFAASVANASAPA